MKSKKRNFSMLLMGALVLGGLTLSINSYANGLTNTQYTQQNIISLEEANKIALQQTNNGQILYSKLDTEHGILVYDIDVLENNVKREFEIEAATGRIIKMDTKHTKHNNMKHYQNVIANAKISIEDAKKIALQNSKNGIIESIELDSKFGRAIYEVEVVEGILEKEYIIDATTGEILRTKTDF